MQSQKYFPIILLCILAALLAACSPSPQKVVDAWQAALNKGDIDAALSYLAEDVTVNIEPPGPDGIGTYHGHSETRGWYAMLAEARGVTTLSGCKTAGDVITCLDTYADEGLKSMGVDFLEADYVAVLNGGKIQSYTVSMRPESLAKFPPAPEAPPAELAQPAPTSTLAPTEVAVAATDALMTEVRITSAEPLVGKWSGKTRGYAVLHDFQDGGSMLVYVEGEGLISRSRYWFEDGLIKVEDSTGGCINIVGTYEVYATYSGEQPVELRMVMVGEDACSDRKDTWAGGLRP